MRARTHTFFPESTMLPFQLRWHANFIPFHPRAIERSILMATSCSKLSSQLIASSTMHLCPNRYLMMSSGIVGHMYRGHFFPQNPSRSDGRTPAWCRFRWGYSMGEKKTRKHHVYVNYARLRWLKRFGFSTFISQERNINWRILKTKIISAKVGFLEACTCMNLLRGYILQIK